METKIGGGLSGATMGPYRATKLWNDVIRTFRTGLPLGRHRRYMRTYENCFVASDAVDWLHDHLKNNPNFGATVSRSQTVQLMEKFHKSRVFEDVRGGKHNRGELADNRRLFMFTHNSPIKTSRAPLGSKTNLMSQRDPTQPLKLDHEKLTPITCIPPAGLPECRLVARPLTPQEITETWKDHTLESLREAVGLASLSELVDSSLVNGQQIMHNCLYINKNGVVTNIESKDQLPHWTLSAMRCLAHWPNKTDSILPRYPGFERDVFRVITEYFQGLKEPLLTYDMYEVITNVYVFTENRFVKHSSPNTTGFFDTPPSIASFASVENLIMNLTMNTGGPCFRRTDRQSRLHRSASTHDCHTSSTSLHLSNAHPQAESSNIYGTKRYGSMTSLPVQPVTKFETAFGPDNRTVTRVFYTSNSSGSFDSGNGMSSLSRDFFSNGCVDADQNHQITWHNSSEHVESSESQSQTRQRRRIVSGPNGPVPLRRPHSVICAGPNSAEDNLSASHFEYCTLPRLPKDQSRRAQRSESFNQAVVRKQNDNAPHQREDERLHSEKINGNSSNTKYSSLSSGIDNPSFNFDQSSRPSTNKPPPYKPPPGYHRDHQHRYSNSHDKPPHPPRIHIQVEGSGDNNPAALFGPGYRRTARTRHRSNSFTNLTASPITAAPEMGTPSFMKRCGSMPDLSASGVKEKLRDCLQLCLLLLPPANRRKLHLLLRMMSKMLENKELVLDEEQPMRSLLLEKFSRSVLRSPEEADMDELLGVQIVGFLVDNYMEIMSVPVKLKTKVEDDLTQMKHSSTKIVYSLEDPSMITYCKQVSMAEFDKQQQTFSQDALSDLLDAIINDNTMGNKEKRKRMKEFQKTYPLIYDKRFPTKESEAEIFPTSTQEKPALLRRPLQKLRNMRL